MKKRGDKKNITKALNNLVRVYSKNVDLAKSKAYAERSLKISEEMGYKENHG